MDQNPYHPPSAALLPEEIPNGSPKKPKAAWLVQILAVAFVVTFLVGMLRFSLSILGNESVQLSLPRVVFDMVWRLALTAAIAAAVVGTQRRAAYGRVLGLAFIVLLSAACLYSQFGPAAELSDPGGARLAGPERVGEIIGQMLVYGLLAYWFFAFGFSKKARAYFRRPIKA